MDEKLQHQLIRQLKWLNFLIISFGILLLATLIVLGFMLFKVLTYVQDVGYNIQEFQQNAGDSVNVQRQACSQEGAIGDYLRNNTDICR